MTSLMKWGRSPSHALRREIEDLIEDFSMPRPFRREIERLFDEDLSTRSLWREMDQLLDEFNSPTSLRSRIERLFEGGRGKIPFWSGRADFVPAVELTEQDKEYLLKVDLPGMREQDVDVSINDDNVLTIRGERREEKTKNVRGYEYSERTYGSFSRAVTLPPGVDQNRIEADFHNGVLEVHVPKTAGAMATRRIPIAREEGRIPANGPTVHTS
jgi:HSP20 family protein